jgi:hypothetical protein
MKGTYIRHECTEQVELIVYTVDSRLQKRTTGSVQSSSASRKKTDLFPALNLRPEHERHVWITREHVLHDLECIRVESMLPHIDRGRYADMMCSLQDVNSSLVQE